MHFSFSQWHSNHSGQVPVTVKTGFLVTVKPFACFRTCDCTLQFQKGRHVQHDHFRMAPFAPGAARVGVRCTDLIWGFFGRKKLSESLLCAGWLYSSAATFWPASSTGRSVFDNVLACLFQCMVTTVSEQSPNEHSRRDPWLKPCNL